MQEEESNLRALRGLLYRTHLTTESNRLLPFPCILRTPTRIRTQNDRFGDGCVTSYTIEAGGVPTLTVGAPLGS